MRALSIGFTLLFALAIAAPANAAPLPSPMPEVIRGKCPGLPAAAGCFIAAGEADVREIWEAGYDYYPTRRMHARACRLIVAAAGDTGAPVAVDGSR